MLLENFWKIQYLWDEDELLVDVYCVLRRFLKAHKLMEAKKAQNFKADLTWDRGATLQSCLSSWILYSSSLYYF